MKIHSHCIPALFLFLMLTFTSSSGVSNPFSARIERKIEVAEAEPVKIAPPRYVGYIMLNDQITALLQIDDLQYSVIEGDLVQGIRILAIDRDWLLYSTEGVQNRINNDSLE